MFCDFPCSGVHFFLSKFRRTSAGDMHIDFQFCTRNGMGLLQNGGGGVGVWLVKIQYEMLFVFWNIANFNMQNNFQ